MLYWNHRSSLWNGKTNSDIYINILTRLIPKLKKVNVNSFIIIKNSNFMIENK